MRLSWFDAGVIDMHNTDFIPSTFTCDATIGGNITAIAPVNASAIESDDRVNVAGTPTGGGDEISDAAGRMGIGGTNETKVEG